ncbi:MAG: SGNH/GDSL hydrolase family protein [Bacteroidota bacterium]
MQKRYLFFPVLLMIPMIFLLVDWVQPPKKWRNTPPGSLYTDSIIWTNTLASTNIGKPAYQFVQRDTNLPDVLVMGNSISIGYTAPLRNSLAGKANVYRIPDNGRDIRKGVNKASFWLAGGKGWEVIHFNWGLHDFKRLVNGQFDSSGDRYVSPTEYKQKLDTLIQKLLETDAQLIFATTTVVPDSAQGRIKGDEILYNELAFQVLANYPQIMLDDQHRTSLTQPEYQKPKNVHFLPEGYDFLAKFTAKRILQGLMTYASTH